MCNCGKKRTELKQQPITQHKINIVTTQPAQQSKQSILFQYTGKTGLTVTGNFTRKNYRFNFSGDIQSIDSRDANAMATIPVLKRV